MLCVYACAPVCVYSGACVHICEYLSVCVPLFAESIYFLKYG